MIAVYSFAIKQNRVWIAPDSIASVLQFSMLASKTQKLLTKLVTKTIPYILTLCIVQSNKFSKRLKLKLLPIQRKMSLLEFLDFSYQYSLGFCYKIAEPHKIVGSLSVISMFPFFKNVFQHFALHKRIQNITQEFQSLLKYLILCPRHSIEFLRF